MSKFKTVIELVCEAEDKREALDVAGEYLRGSLTSGVNMRCQTRQLPNLTKVLLTLSMVVVLIGAGVITTSIAQPHGARPADIAYSACQVPLRTQSVGRERAEFETRWKAGEVSAAIERAGQ